jgi:hypothetical protein
MLQRLRGDATGLSFIQPPMKNLDIKTRIIKPRATRITTPGSKRGAAPAKPGKRRVIASFPPEIEEAITVVEAQVQLGPSDSLYIRGQGSGLSWEAGQPMTWVEPAKWVWCTRAGQPGTEFKVLVNDEVWSMGENSVLRPGDVVRIQPQFEICVPT